MHLGSVGSIRSSGGEECSVNNTAGIAVGTRQEGVFVSVHVGLGSTGREGERQAGRQAGRHARTHPSSRATSFS